MARLARASGLSNLARLALERLLETRADHVLALRMLRDVLLEIGDVAACREVPRYHDTFRLLIVYTVPPMCGVAEEAFARVGFPLVRVLAYFLLRIIAIQVRVVRQESHSLARTKI